jgi:membrane-associated phospholipid phosphatase
LTTPAVGLCMGYVDRPIAQVLETTIRHTQQWLWLNRAIYPIPLVVIGALVFLLSCGAWLISGRKLGSGSEAPWICSWATMWAVAAEHILKQLFGRGWPDPTFVRDDLTGFHFLHGETFWNSFPSGTAAVSFAILTVLWIVRPSWRMGSSIIVAMILAAVMLGNYHWLSDLIAGGYVGAFIGSCTVGLLRPNRTVDGS